MPATYHVTRTVTALALALLHAAATAESRLVRRVLLRAADVASTQGDAAGVRFALEELDRGLQVTRRDR